MKAWFVVAGLAAVLLGACQKKAEAPATGLFGGNGPRGRYVAVGLYSPGQMWAHLKPAPAPAEPPADPDAATLADDEQIIVVMDSATGELRQCGNLSSHCIGFNPWAKPLGATQSAPVQLLKHAQQLHEEAEAAARSEGPEIEFNAQKR